MKPTITRYTKEEKNSQSLRESFIISENVLRPLAINSYVSFIGSSKCTRKTSIQINRIYCAYMS